MTIEEVKHWLKRAGDIEKECEELEALVNQSRERATGLSRCGEYNSTGKSATRSNRAENALARLADIEHKYNSRVQELTKAEQEIKSAISELQDPELECVLTCRYLLFNTGEQTAEIMNYSTATIRRKTKQALEKMCGILSTRSE